MRVVELQVEYSPGYVTFESKSCVRPSNVSSSQIEWRHY